MVRLGERRVPGVLLALAAVISGCQEPPPRLDDDGVSAIQFQDIPVPEGMRLQEQFHRSDSRAVGDYRYGNFVYAGVTPIADISAYLLERMPQHSWLLESSQVEESGDQSMRFRRGRYVLECNLRKQPDATSRMEVAVRTRLPNP